MQTKQIGKFFLEQYQNGVKNFSKKASSQALKNISHPNASKYIFGSMEDVLYKNNAWEEGIELFGEDKMQKATKIWKRANSAQNMKNLNMLDRGISFTDEQTTNIYDTLANMLSDTLDKWSGI